MAILGVLLGITISVLAGCIWVAKNEREIYAEAAASLADRISMLESRTRHMPGIAQHAQASSEGVGKVASYRVRTWNEDTAQAEAK